MEFEEFRVMLRDHFADMSNGQRFLFHANVDKDALWETYLESFPPGTNEVFRQRREFDCSCCRTFIKQFGGIATIKDSRLVSIWDFDPGDKFAPVVSALAKMVKSAAVQDVFVTKDSGYGTLSNLEDMETHIHTWNHFRIDLPKKFVDTSSKSVGDLTGQHRDSKNVLKRSLEEISRDALETVLDLIAEDSLYRGEQWQEALTKFLGLHERYCALSDAEQDNFCWDQSTRLGGAISRIRNHSIGVLLTEITEGKPVLDAVARYEGIVDPTNYMRTKRTHTMGQVKLAQKFVAEHGLEDSLGRRHARLDGISIQNVLWANRDAAKVMDNGRGVWDALFDDVQVKPKKYEHVPGIGIMDFVGNVLPGAASVEVMVESRHQKNLMSLIAPQNADSKSLFQWDNGFSWAYVGNVTDSLKERVKAAGGNVTGDLRFSIQWNLDQLNSNDYDAHGFEPSGEHIFFGRMRSRSGELDVDIIHPKRGVVAVENIVYPSRRGMPKGVYEFKVHCYSHRGGRDGFEAEIEFDGQIYEYSHRRDLQQSAFILVARVLWDGDKFTILDSLPSVTASRQVWGLTTNQFVPVSCFMFSPNYWDGQGVGNRHYFWMLAGCQNPDAPNGFYNEFLRNEFREHRRVFEALGAKMKVQPTDDQLSGLGFSSTKRDSLIVRVDGQINKVVF